MIELSIGMFIFFLAGAAFLGSLITVIILLGDGKNNEYI